MGVSLEDPLANNAPDAPRVSIVIPVWNGAATLGRCLQSIVAQGFPGIEVIVVDDGSTDDTSRLAAAFGSMMRLILLYQCNRGVSVARNAGMARACGRYVMFMDADDQLAPHALEQRWSKAEAADCELFLDNAWWHARDGMAEPLLPASLPDWTGSGRQWISERQPRGQLKHYVWLQFIRRDFLEASGLGFVPGISHQDIVWTNALLLQAARVCFSARPAYHYFLAPGTLSHPEASCGRLAAAKHYLRVTFELAGLARVAREPELRAALSAQIVQEGIAVLQIARRLEPSHRLALFRLVRGSHHVQRMLAYAGHWREQARILRRASRFLVWLGVQAVTERLLRPIGRQPVSGQPGSD